MMEIQREKMDNAMLNRFYEDNVKMIREETKMNIDFVFPLVKDILQYVHDRDSRFKAQALNVGSYYSHLKVARADEFDYSVVLDIPPLQWTDTSKKYYGFDQNKQHVVRTSFPLPDPPVGKHFTTLTGIVETWDKQRINEGPGCITIDNDIIPIKVKRRFKSLVAEAVNRTRIRQFVDVKKLSESPAATLTVVHPNIAGQSISIDLAPLIEAHSPFKPEFGWPRSGGRWPSSQKVNEIKTKGIHTVAKDPFYWSLSFVTCEKMLLDRIDINGTCRKKSQRILKKLREIWCPKGMKQELTSYHLKNILFWECENHPCDTEWTNDMLATRVESMCYLLVQHIQRGALPLYFHTGVNLLESKDKDVLKKVEQNIINFVHDPTKYL